MPWLDVLRQQRPGAGTRRARRIAVVGRRHRDFLGSWGPGVSAPPLLTLAYSTLFFDRQTLDPLTQRALQSCSLRTVLPQTGPSLPDVLE